MAHASAIRRDECGVRVVHSGARKGGPHDHTGRRISSPLHVPWSGRGALASWDDTLAVWREWTDDVSGAALDCGHFLMEEAPAETPAAVRRFHAVA